MHKFTKSEVLGMIELLICSIIWGFAFVAQKKASENITPLYLNGIRFLIAGMLLTPIVIYVIKKKTATTLSIKKTILIGFLTGLFLAIASNIQQFGVERTTAGKAGFLTAMYIILVPIFTFFVFKKKLTIMQIIGVVVAVVGVGLISLKNDFTINVGDLLCMAGAIFFTIEIMLVDYYSKKIDPFLLSMICFLTVGVLSLSFAIPIENNSFTFEKLGNAIVPMLFLAIGSSCIAYTLQNLGQKRIDGTPASLLMSLESVFALIGGIIILNDRLNIKEWIGCFLLLSGVFIVQIFVRNDESNEEIEEKEKCL
jgi:drug/metabolite transporter (DMT)-like permease